MPPSARAEAMPAGPRGSDAGKADRFGGSHAQRDVFSWPLVEAALRFGDEGPADAMAAERLAAEPDSPPDLAWRGAASVGVSARPPRLLRNPG